MIDLLKLNYKKQEITKTEGAENTLFLLDHETKTGFGRDNIGMYCFQAKGCEWIYSEIPIQIIKNNQPRYLTKGDVCNDDNGILIIMTHTKEEVIQKAIEYFLPLADKNDENFILREGEIFLN